MKLSKRALSYHVHDRIKSEKNNICDILTKRHAEGVAWMQCNVYCGNMENDRQQKTLNR